MNIHRFYIGILAITNLLVLAACMSHDSSEENVQEEYAQIDKSVSDNPLDSIVHITKDNHLYEEVYKYLNIHPEFIKKSDSIGYLRYPDNDNDDCCFLWKDCGDIRLYSIPCSTMYATYSEMLVQFRSNGKLDTTLRYDNPGMLGNIQEIKNSSGEKYYIINTRGYAMRHGEVVEEYISAFSIENGHVRKNNLFHTNGRKYDIINVDLWKYKHPILNCYSAILISVTNFKDGKTPPAFVVAEINENGWPTGNGLKYLWNGEWFEYVGKCIYNLDDYFY